MATDEQRPRELWGTPIHDVRSTRGIVTRCTTLAQAALERELADRARRRFT